MKILVIGNMGYVGPVLISYLRRVYGRTIHITGYDSGLFSGCLLDPRLMPEALLNTQYFADTRALNATLFEGFEAVVYLAAVSNDPMGQRFATVTDEINHHSALAAAAYAKAAGVRSFVFASSCSVYGAAEDGKARKEGDELNPLTAYALSKINAETDLKTFDAGSMSIRCLRFATACGYSPRLRLDLVLNDFVACALSGGKITVLSDGSPWRPLIHVDDMARAIDWACFHSADAAGFLVVNVGSETWNWQIRQLAEAVQTLVPGTDVQINTNAPPDKRSYRVDFAAFAALAPGHVPQVTLKEAIIGLRDGLKRTGFKDPDFRNSNFIRLRTLESLIADGSVGEDLKIAHLG